MTSPLHASDLLVACVRNDIAVRARSARRTLAGWTDWLARIAEPAAPAEPAAAAAALALEHRP